MRKNREQIFDFKEWFFSETQEARHLIRFQNPYEDIFACAEKINAGWAFMGSKGNSDFKEILIGSNTEKVVWKSTIPVLVVKIIDKTKN